MELSGVRLQTIARIVWHQLAIDILFLQLRLGFFVLKKVDIVKWVATAIQLIGYGLTGLNIVPWNVFAFVIGIVLWFLVGVMWKDRAIMVVHMGAFIAILGGYLSS